MKLNNPLDTELLFQKHYDNILLVAHVNIISNSHLKHLMDNPLINSNFQYITLTETHVPEQHAIDDISTYWQFEWKMENQHTLQGMSTFNSFC